MLVLTRKAGEEIRIGDNIVVSVFRIKGQRARLGIEAPSGIVIRRKELLFDDEDLKSDVPDQKLQARERSRRY